MRYDLERHHRRTVRLRDYDYRSAGAYFITLCTVERAMLFGEVRDRDMHLTSHGHIVLDAWMETALIRPGVILDEFMVMPNHFHAIVFLPDRAETNDAGANVGAHSSAPAGHGTHEPPLRMRHPCSLGALVAGFKGATTKQINALRGTPGFPVWQRNYYEHIVRNDEDLQRIREYIANNPVTWESDSEYRGQADDL